ncbi:RES domain-containing protein [Dyella sp. 2RAB6]|uniref:RES domain-containing protein n=1 Tax=Dyella sp. 2RAB6 TaxID=3232992 RepID=UPI003F915B04
MTHGEDALLEQVAFDAMPATIYGRVHPARLQDGTPVDPLSSNPRSTARMAIQPALVAKAPALGMFYAATTSAGALFEALLRHASIYPKRQVYLPRNKLKGQRLALVELRRPLDIIPLGLPDRRIVVPDENSWRETRWRELISTADHRDTHAAALAVYEQVRAAGFQHHGLSWPSIQAPHALVYLLYDPPFQRADWSLIKTIELDTAEGETFIADALATAGYAWLADPAGGAYDPDPDAI